jgi:hypothetical protein
MPDRLTSRLSLGLLLALSLVVAACGGSTAPTPPGYMCNFAGSYCATYADFGTSDFSGSPTINGAYTYIQNTNLTCTAACAAPATAGYVSNMLMMNSSDNSNWVEAGVWNDGYVNPSLGFLGPGITLVYGVGINGNLTYRPVLPVSSLGSPAYGIGVEIQRYSASGGTDNGYLFRYAAWYGGPVASFTANPISIVGQQAPSAPLTHVETGEFLHGTSGATADLTAIDPPQVTSNVVGSTSLPAITSGYPNNLYPNLVGPSSAGIPLHFFHDSESLTFPGGSGPPVAVGSPPYGAWWYTSSSPLTFHWTTTSDANPVNDIMFFTCCGGSFR